MTELQQTKGRQRFEGIIVKFNPDEEYTYREGETNDGRPYKSLNLAIKTNVNNVVYNLGLFGMVRDKVKVFSNKNNERKSMEIGWEDRFNLPEGFTCIGFGTCGVALEKNEEGKIKLKRYFNYDAIDVIKDNLNEGDSVWIETEFNIDTYVGQDGNEKTSVKYNILNIGLLKDPIDFESEEFSEVSSFEQEIVLIDHQLDNENKKLYVTGRIINYDQSFNDVTFVVDGNKYPTLAKNIIKRTKFGDVLTIVGKIRNGTELIEVEEEELDWGGENPKGITRMNGRPVSELQITNVKKHTPKVYKEEDFIVEKPFEHVEEVEEDDDLEKLFG